MSIRIHTYNAEMYTYMYMWRESEKAFLRSKWVMSQMTENIMTPTTNNMKQQWPGIRHRIGSAWKSAAKTQDAKTAKPAGTKPPSNNPIISLGYL